MGQPVRRNRHSAFAASGNYKASACGYAGGSKKSGTGTNGIGKRSTINEHIKIEGNPSAFMRNMIFPNTNQVGGIGVGRSLFAGSGFGAAGGVKRQAQYQFTWACRAPK